MFSFYSKKLISPPKIKEVGYDYATKILPDVISKSESIQKVMDPEKLNALEVDDEDEYFDCEIDNTDTDLHDQDSEWEFEKGDHFILLSKPVFSYIFSWALL